MKIKSYEQLCENILLYNKFQNEMRSNSKAYKSVNSMVKKLTNYILNIINSNELEAVKIIDKLLSEYDIRLSSYGATWALHSNYKVNKAVEIMKVLAENTDYEQSRLSASIFLDVYNGKFGGWKRDGIFPDLNKYEKKSN